MAFSLNLKRVLISDSVDNCCKTILEANGIAVDLKTKLTEEELLAAVPVRYETNFDKFVTYRFYSFILFFIFRTMTV